MKHATTNNRSAALHSGGAENVKQCARCRAIGYQHDTHCPQCGGAFARICRACGAAVSHPVAFYCAGCGTPLEHREANDPTTTQQRR